MRGMKFWAIALATVVASVVLAITAEAAGPLTLKRDATITDVTRTKKSFKAKLLLTSDGAAVGTARYKCRGLRSEPRCWVRSKFSEGKIVARGLFEGRANGRIPIVGGSGIFDDAEGWLVFKSATAAGTDGRLIYKLERYG